MEFNWSEFWNNLVNNVVPIAANAVIRVLLALLILFVSFRIINAVTRRIERKQGEKGKIDKTILKTLMYLLRLALKIVIAVCLVGFVGIETSGLTALIASLGVCFGLAVNGAVANIAGGVLILITRPFRIDDFIEVGGYSGVVEDIHLVNTKLRTGDNKVIFIPNSTASSSAVVNYSMKDTRRVDFTFSIGYGCDFEKAKALVSEILSSNELTLDDPAPMVRVSAHGASSVDLVARAWVKSADYWTVNFDVLEKVKKCFDENGIEIPFNQLDVHLRKD